MSLIATTAAGRLVGYGRAGAPVDIFGDQIVTVSIPLRRPFAYVAGGTKLNLFDTTLEQGAAYKSILDLGPSRPVAVATSPNGMDVVVTRTVRDSGGRVIHSDRWSSHYIRVDGVLQVGVG